MRRISLALPTVLMAAAFTFMPGCVGDQESILVTHAIPFADSDSCTADPAGSTHLASGAIDVSFDTGYTAAFSVLNNLSQTGVNGTNTGIEASEMKLTEAIVELSMPGNPTIIDAVRAVDSSLVRYSQPLATDSFDGGDRLAPFVFIPNSTLSEINAQMGGAGVQRAQMVMTVVFRAQRSSNSSKAGIVESREFDLPIEVCSGCLRDCQSTVTEAGDELCTAEACSSGTAVAGGGRCGNAQGGSVSPQCCTGDDAENQALVCQ